MITEMTTEEQTLLVHFRNLSGTARVRVMDWVANGAVKISPFRFVEGHFEK